MTFRLSTKDAARWEAFCNVVEQNEHFTRLLADYLNHTPRLITARMVKNLAGECALPQELAYRVLLAAAIGLDTATNELDKQLEKSHLLPALNHLEPSKWQQDAYLKTIVFPNVRLGRWSFGTERYAPYEPFVCDLPKQTENGLEIPQIGYFTNSFSFPAVRENGVEWMAVKPSEIATMRAPLAAAHGHTVAFGLGLGYFAFHASEKETVCKVTVVDRDPNVIDLFCTHLLPQFPHKEKIELVCADAFDFAAKTLPTAKADVAFVDLWHDQSDGLPLYLQMRQLEKSAPQTEFQYWIEPILLSSLRRIVFDKLREDGPGEISSFAEIQDLLSNASLRALALNIRQINKYPPA